MDWKALHKDALVIDSHNDSIVAHVSRGNLSFSGGKRPTEWPGTVELLHGRSGAAPGAAEIQVNLSSLSNGGIDAGFYAIDVTRARNNRLAYALDGFGGFFEDIERSGAAIQVVRETDDIISAKRRGIPAVVLAIEHADCTEGSLNVLRMLYELGVRSIGLTHHVSSEAADGCMEARDGVGLTKYGVKLVQAMNRLGMLVDLAHISPSGFFHALEVSSKPVTFSHGNCRALRDFPRNLTDDQLKCLSRNGGFIGMSYVADFIDATSPSIERLLDHIDHAVQVGGIEVVGLGGDFDGGGAVLRDATQVPLITEGLVKRGYTEAGIRKLLGENTLRVLKETID